MPVTEEEQEGMIDKIMELFQSNEASIEYGENPNDWIEQNMPDGADAADVGSCMPAVAEGMGGVYQQNAAHYNASYASHGASATSTVMNEISYNYNTIYQQNTYIHAEPGAQVTNIQGDGNMVNQTQIDGQFEPEPPPLYGGDMIVVEGDMAMTREQFVEEYGQGALAYVDPDGNFEVPEGFTHIEGGLVTPGGHILNDDGTEGPPVYIVEGEEGELPGYEEEGEEYGGEEGEYEGEEGEEYEGEEEEGEEEGEEYEGEEGGYEEGEEYEGEEEYEAPEEVETEAYDGGGGEGGGEAAPEAPPEAPMDDGGDAGAIM